MLLSNLRHWQQQHDFDCLVICCQMVLSYLGIEKTEEWLWDVLNAGHVTPFSKVIDLADELGLRIDFAQWGNPEIFETYIEQGLPVIVAVSADRSDSWPYYKDHAVVVVGFNEQNMFLNDPAQPDASLEVDLDTFMLAWAYRDYEYAVIRLQ